MERRTASSPTEVSATRVHGPNIFHLGRSEYALVRSDGVFKTVRAFTKLGAKSKADSLTHWVSGIHSSTDEKIFDKVFEAENNTTVVQDNARQAEIFGNVIQPAMLERLRLKKQQSKDAEKL